MCGKSKGDTVSPSGKRSRRQLIWIFILAGTVILLIWGGLKVWRTYQAASSLLARQSEAELMLAGGLTAVDPLALEELVYGLRGDVVAIKQELDFLLPVLPLLSWVPRIGPLAAAAPHLMAMADAGTEAAAYAYRGLKPALLVMQTDDAGSSSPIPQFLQIIEEAKPDLAQSSLAMDRVIIARDELGNTEALPWRVRTLLDKADEWLPLAGDGLKLTQVLPEIMGLYNPRRYLLIAQNENEIRATGGFISGAGLIEIDKGRIVRIDFQDANSVDAWTDKSNTFGALSKPYGKPPQALTDFMLLDLFLFRDVNYWPDFPLSAQKAMELYSYGQEIPQLDGAIAIDQQFMSLLLSGTGPVIIPDSGETINQYNIIDSLHEAWTLQDGVLERKSFLGTFSLAIYDRLENNPSAIDPITLAKQMGKALKQKHLQIYISDPDVVPVLKNIGWDGRLSSPDDHDALMTVDMNVGYNKANLFIEKEMLYDVHLNNDGTGQADLTITHKHNGDVSDEPCWQGTMDEYRNKAPYLALADKCYWNFLRVYVPEGSQLISGPQHLVPGETWFGGYDWDQPTEVVSELPGFTTFSNFMLIPRGASLISQYRYQLPATITQVDGQIRQYQLHLIKQAGVSPYQVLVTVTLPVGTKLESVSPELDKKDSTTLQFTIELDSDQWITVRYK